jgi:hypothetical protein
MDHAPPYLMSFATGGLYINESLAVAQYHQPGISWDVTAVAARQAGAFPVRKSSSAQRSIREIVNRLRCLTPEELEAFQTSNRSEQAAILWLAACRAYRFIGEFVVEVVADRYASLRLDLTHDDFDAFYAAKAEWSPKLAGLSQSTRSKLRAVLFRMMREANILSPTNKIMGAMLSSQLMAIIRCHDPADLRYFPGAVINAQG